METLDTSHADTHEQVAQDGCHNQVEDNKEDDLRKVLHLYMNKLDTSDREIIRDCRRELFNKMREMFRGFHDRFNHTGPHGFGHGFGSARDHEPREGHHPSASISKPQNN